MEHHKPPSEVEYEITPPAKPTDAARSVRPRESLSRIADALEKLAADPEVEIEVGPPVCPSCGKLNPTVALPNQEGGQGPMAEIIVTGHCIHCGGSFFIVIESFSVHQSITTAGEEIEARKKAGLFSVEDQ